MASYAESDTTLKDKISSIIATKGKILNFLKLKLAYLKDSNAAAHSVDSDIFQSSDSSIRALQDLTLTFICDKGS